MDLGLTKRNNILTHSLIIENWTSKFLSTLLGIVYNSDSKIFGNKSGCLSFNQKIDLLIEIEALSKNDRSKFQAFMEIRNQFMHNIESNSYEKCLSMTNGTDKFLLKTYPQDKNLNLEEQFKKAINQLADDLGKLIDSLKKKIDEKIKNEAEMSFTKRSETAFMMAIDQIKEYFNSKKIENLNEFGTELHKIFYGLWKQNMELIISNEKSKVAANKTA